MNLLLMIWLTPVFLGLVGMVCWMLHTAYPHGQSEYLSLWGGFFVLMLLWPIVLLIFAIALIFPRMDKDK